jgi:hypothetical protein
VDSRNEYGVVVHAFDASGQLLTFSPAHFPSLMSGSARITEKDAEQMQQDRKPIDAAMVLAEEERQRQTGNVRKGNVRHPL